MSNLDPLTAYEDDPSTDNVHHPYSAYNQGFDAGEKGLGAGNNPYAMRPLRSWWADGYKDGAEAISVEKASAE